MARNDLTANITLRVRKDGSIEGEVRRTTAALDKVTGATRRTTRATEQAAAANQRANRTWIEAHRHLLRYGGYLGSGYLLHSIRRSADSYTELTNRLRLVTDSEESLIATRKELLDISQRTRTALDANANLYSRLSLAADSTGKSQAELLRVTELLNKQVVIGGNNASEAAASITCKRANTARHSMPSTAAVACAAA